MKIVCDVCPNLCRLDKGQVGFCRARKNINDKIVSVSYGLTTSLALDPIEKKPLYHFMPRTYVLSVGSFGCNLRCPFCQNHSISMCDEHSQTVAIPKEDLIKKAIQLKKNKCSGIAFTYNEPLIGWEYVLDTAKLCKENNLATVVVTNGYTNKNTLEKVLPYIDAMNIDLKSFNQDFYKKVHGDLDSVKNTIELASKQCHVEVTLLVIPDENDSVEEITALSKWIMTIDKNIPLHISRFFPAYKYTHLSPTPVDKVYEFVNIAKEYLNFVYAGNC